jgi:hemerythrin-like domain-containing protein
MNPRPTHILRHEHRVIEQVLRALNGMALKLKLGEPVPPEALGQALDFIRTFADHYHHRREEEYLFPFLEECGLGEAGGALSFLHEEHVRERELQSELELALDEYRHGDPGAASRILATSEQYASHLVAHMQKEDTLLFRFAEDLLETEAKTALIQRLAQHANTPQAALVRKYEQLAAQLEQAWAV